MRRQKRRKSRWKIAVAVVAAALLSCGVLITLGVRKVAAEKKSEQKFEQDKTLAKPPPTFPPLQERESK